MKQSYTVILDWMLDLGLTASELLAYATIYGFCMDGESAYTGSRSYLARKMAAGSKRTVDNALQGLQEKGLIAKAEKTINGVKFCEYSIVWEQVNTACKDCAPGANSAPAPGANSAPNNKEIENKDISLSSKRTREVFKAPTVEEVRAYCAERQNNVDAETFVDFYTGKGWKVGSTPMKDWRAAVRTWEKRDNRGPQKAPYNAYPGAAGPSPRPGYPMPTRGGVIGSEALVQAAMEEYNR